MHGKSRPRSCLPCSSSASLLLHRLQPKVTSNSYSPSTEGNSGGLQVDLRSSNPPPNQMARSSGIRGKDESGRLNFLGFLFLFPEKAPLTSAKCRDGVLEPKKNSNRTLTILKISDTAQPSNLPVSLVSYTKQDRNGKPTYSCAALPELASATI